MARAHRHLRGIQTGSMQSVYEANKALADDIDAINARLGLNPNFQDTQGAQPVNNPPPSPAQFTIVGVDGRFKVAITNPQNIQPATAAVFQQNATAILNPTGAAIYHQLQSGTDTNFNANSNVTTYGPSTDTVLDVTDPVQTKFWRLRSSFDQSNWNAWQLFQSAATCGPVAVSSGALRSTSAVAGLQLNSTNFATVDSFDAGSSATIRIYGTGGIGTTWTRQVGTTTQGPNAAANITGKSYNTQYYIMWDGSQYYALTTLPATLPDNYQYVGTVVTLPSSGGTTATATAVMSGTAPNETVASVNITNGGSGYSSAPGVTFNGGGGSGAAGYATVSGGAVISITMTNSGSGYSSGPTVAFSGGQSGVSGGGQAPGGHGGTRYNIQ